MVQSSHGHGAGKCGSEDKGTQNRAQVPQRRQTR